MSGLPSLRVLSEAGARVQWQQWRPTENAVAFPLGTAYADSGILVHLVGHGLLDEEVDVLSGPAVVSPGRVVPTVKLRFLTVNLLILKKPMNSRVRAALSIQPLQHVIQHFQSQWQSCRPEMNGHLEAMETPNGKSQHLVPGSRALVP